jgi:hypothetical protein
MEHEKTQEAIESVSLTQSDTPGKPGRPKMNPRPQRHRQPLEIPLEDRELWHRGRVAALAQNKTIGKFLMDALRAYLEPLKKEPDPLAGWER